MDLPLIAFVHVPKTAGTTVNVVLRQCSHRGRSDSHFVVRARNEAAYLALVRRSDWLSGHIRRHNFSKALIWSGRKVEYFSVVRDPVDHLLSLLNYSLQRYEQHQGLTIGQEEQLDGDIAMTDLADPAALQLLLLRHPIMLDMQSAYVLGEDFADISNEEVSRRLTTYTCVSTADDLPRLYRAFGFAQLPPATDELWENKSVRRVSKTILCGPEMQEFLSEHHRHDRRLYDAVRATKWEAETRLPYRPSFLEATAVTAQTFDEEAYLASNPDVAEGVAKGLLASGREHFESFGRNERRSFRVRVDP